MTYLINGVDADKAEERAGEYADRWSELKYPEGTPETVKREGWRRDFWKEFCALVGWVG